MIATIDAKGRPFPTEPIIMGTFVIAAQRDRDRDRDTLWYHSELGSSKWCCKPYIYYNFSKLRYTTQ